DGAHVWVASGFGQSADTGEGVVTELDATTGAVIRVISKPKYGFDSPIGIAVGNGDVSVSSDGTDDSPDSVVSELDANTGAFVRTLRAHLNAPGYMTVTGGDVWVTNGANCVTVFNVRTGAVA